MPSKLIYIKRTAQFVHEGMKSQAMQEQLSYSKVGIGGYFQSKTSTLSGTGLTEDEVKLLLPSVIGVTTQNLEFTAKVEKFYQDINTLIPHGDGGRVFEIGLKIDNTQPLSPENKPLNLDDYIRYRHAVGRIIIVNGKEVVDIKGHPQVVLSPDDKANPLAAFYVEDPDKQLAVKHNQLKAKDDAIEAYMLVKKDENKAKMVLTLMAAKLKPLAGQLIYDPEKAKEMENALNLKKLSEEHPVEFVRFSTDPEISRKYFVQSLVMKGIIIRKDNDYLDPITRQVMGNRLGQVVAFLHDPKNIATLNEYKRTAKMQGVTAVLED